MWTPVIEQGQVWAYTCQQKSALFVFGTRELTAETMLSRWPQFEFCFLQQVHGKLVLEANPQLRPEADGHFTRQRGRALVVQSADCLPILLANSSSAMALHAGWRGVAQNIVAAGALAQRDFIPEHVEIGPHIRQESFEVGLDVAEQIGRAGPPPLAPTWKKSSEHSEKVCVDLAHITTRQLHASFGPSLNVTDIQRDTYVATEFYSFRRDRKTAGRNLSFVVLID